MSIKTVYICGHAIKRWRERVEPSQVWELAEVVKSARRVGDDEPLSHALASPTEITITTNSGVVTSSSNQWIR